MYVSALVQAAQAERGNFKCCFILRGRRHFPYCRAIKRECGHTGTAACPPRCGIFCLHLGHARRN